MEMDCKVKEAIMIYMIFVVIIMIKRPRILFKNRNNFTIRKFGLGKDKTLFSIHIIFIFLSIFISACYYK